MIQRLFLIAICAGLLLGCAGDRAPAGIAARVNGHSISLDYVRALIDSHARAPVRPSFEELREDYANAIGAAIAFKLVRREAETRHPAIIREVESTMAENEFLEDDPDAYFADIAIRPDDWRELTFDTLVMELFIERVIRPQVRIAPSEIRDYYKQHENAFAIGERLDLCYLASTDREQVSAWCAMIARGDAPEDDGAMCLSATPGDVIQEWREAVATLRPGSCAGLRQEDGGYRSIGLLSRSLPEIIPPASAYALIEKELAQERVKNLMDQWLEAKVAGSDIVVTPEMAGCLAVAAASMDADSAP